MTEEELRKTFKRFVDQLQKEIDRILEELKKAIDRIKFTEKKESHKIVRTYYKVPLKGQWVPKTQKAKARSRI